MHDFLSAAVFKKRQTEHPPEQKLFDFSLNYQDWQPKNNDNKSFPAAIMKPEGGWIYI